MDQQSGSPQLLCTVPGIGNVLAYTIAAEIGDITRFATPTKLVGYSGLCPRVYQSGESDHRGSLAKMGGGSSMSAHRAATCGRPCVDNALRSQRMSARLRTQPRKEDRQGRYRPPPRRGDLAHVAEERTFRSGRRRLASGRVTAPNGIALRERTLLPPA